MHKNRTLDPQADYANATGSLHTARTPPRCDRGLHLAHNAHEPLLFRLTSAAPCFNAVCPLLY